MSETKVDRRTFLNTAAGVVAGSAIATTALSYGRILGANDRISLGHIGIGNRGGGLHTMVSQLKGQHNVETTAVCDLWTRNRERAAAEHRAVLRARAARVSALRGAARAERRRRGASSRRQSTRTRPILKAAAEAGKDAYCEKPMGNVLEEVKAARDAVKAAQARRADRHAAPQRAVPAGRTRGAAARRARRREQGTRSCGTTTVRAGAAARR